MKKVLLFVLVIFITKGLVSAQESKLFLTGNLTYWQTKDETKVGSTSSETKTTDFGLGAKLGYHLNENVAIGLGLNYTSNKNEPNDYTTETTTMFYIAPFARFYVFTEDRFRFFIEAELDYGTGQSKYEETSGNVTVTTKYDNTALSLGITPNVEYFLTKKLSMEAGFGFFGYTQSKSEYTSTLNVKHEDTTSSLGLKFLPQTLSFGLTYHF